MIKVLTLASLLAAVATAGAASLSISSEQLEKKGSAKVELSSGKPAQISIRFDDPGWDSGVIVRPPAGEKFWDLSGSRVLAVDVENKSADKQLRLTMQITSGTKEEKTLHRVNSGIALNPGEKRTLNLLIPHRELHAAPQGVPGPRFVDSDKISMIEFFIQWPFESKQKDLADYRLSDLRVTGEPDKITAPAGDAFFPYIDIYGQYMHSDWPEKIHSDDDLKKAHAKELAELNASKRPAEWNRFGGWANGPLLKSTGNFRTEKYKGKWWMVDPEGRLFISHGIDVLHASTDATRTQDHEKWFSFPVTSWTAPFTDWNLAKKYGKKDYASDFYDTLAKRLESWGINTIGDWGKADLIMKGRMPYTLQLTDFNDKMPKIEGSKLKFYDVFDPAYISRMKTLMKTEAASRPEVAKSINDPLCIGYFIDNELNFGNRGRQVLGDAVIKSPAKQASKQEWVKDLKAKYSTIKKFNDAWSTAYADWDAVLAATEAPDSKGFKADSDVFFLKTVDQYFRLCRDSIKTVAPNRLYLGCRFISTDAVRKALYDASLKYCDVLTVNVYAHSTANLTNDKFPDMPVLIGEFHFGILDRGMFSASLAPTGITQAERAVAYTRFLQGALSNPHIVGTHWFQFRDQPLTGRWDGEGYQIGFVDVADTPYVELTQAAREVGENMYEYRMHGKLVNDMR
ncbi:beta-galactosidase [Rariglobus hedericola]|uniref:Beta-agarase n=1 Tax=Rariglobus hedericola TaxID=2597822 RepID=A0A556QSB5_9BACT|nr:beta-galactosidase [Rariglobus hedericola]TSJ79530.1 beta-agarase [Rariglobus hedericola]